MRSFQLAERGTLGRWYARCTAVVARSDYQLPGRAVASLSGRSHPVVGSYRSLGQKRLGLDLRGMAGQHS